MKRIKTLLYSLLSIIMFSPIMVLADSGLESKYEQSDSVVGAVISAVFQSLSFLIKLFTEQPGSDDYIVCRNIVAIICLITIYIFTSINLFKIDKKKKYNAVIKLSISLIPTLLLTLICFLTNFYTIIYVLVLTVYIITVRIIVNRKCKSIFDEEMNVLKELDKKFNEEDFNKEAFNIYKDVQLAWCDFDLDKVKDIISDDLYNTYTNKLDELKSKNRKNVMTDIELKSSKIIDVSIDDQKETITVELNVDCIDYIIDNEDKVVSGNKDKKINYTYNLIYSKNIKDKKYVLINKKLIKTKTK